MFTLLLGDMTAGKSGDHPAQHSSCVCCLQVDMTKLRDMAISGTEQLDCVKPSIVEAQLIERSTS